VAGTTVNCTNRDEGILILREKKMSHKEKEMRREDEKEEDVAGKVLHARQKKRKDQSSRSIIRRNTQGQRCTKQENLRGRM
jgi:hypothetical protein